MILGTCSKLAVYSRVMIDLLFTFTFIFIFIFLCCGTSVPPVILCCWTFSFVSRFSWYHLSVTGGYNFSSGLLYFDSLHETSFFSFCISTNRTYPVLAAPFGSDYTLFNFILSFKNCPKKNCKHFFGQDHITLCSQGFMLGHYYFAKAKESSWL